MAEEVFYHDDNEVGVITSAAYPGYPNRPAVSGDGVNARVVINEETGVDGKRHRSVLLVGRQDVDGMVLGPELVIAKLCEGCNGGIKDVLNCACGAMLVADRVDWPSKHKEAKPFVSIAKKCSSLAMEEMGELFKGGKDK